MFKESKLTPKQVHLWLSLALANERVPPTQDEAFLNP